MRSFSWENRYKAAECIFILIYISLSDTTMIRCLRRTLSLSLSHTQTQTHTHTPTLSPLSLSLSNIDNHSCPWDVTTNFSFLYFTTRSLSNLFFSFFLDCNGKCHYWCEEETRYHRYFNRPVGEKLTIFILFSRIHYRINLYSVYDMNAIDNQCYSLFKYYHS